MSLSNASVLAVRSRTARPNRNRLTARALPVKKSAKLVAVAPANKMTDIA
jgi:hypothetical protein